MKVNVCELTGKALDWAVAKCETEQQGNQFNTQCNLDDYSPSTDWAIGGHIIQSEWVSTYQVGNKVWKADIAGLFNSGPCETPLIAAMRCYVASVLGNVVDIPDYVM